MKGKNIFLLTLTLSMFITLIIGCSSRGAQEFTGPGDTPPGNDKISQGSDGYSGYASLGAFEVVLNADNLQGEINPVSRSASIIGDNYQLDGTKFFVDQPCANCFRMDGFGINSDGNIIVDFSIKHPFEDITKRLDLDAFDVKLILISDADAGFGYMEFPLSGPVDTNGDAVEENISGNTRFVLNADGYTTHLDMVAELPEKYPPEGLGYDGNLNPYKFFFVEDNPDPVLEGFEIPNHRMQQGATWDSKRFEIKFPTGGGFIKFIAAIEVAYGQSAVRYTRLYPVYYLPQFNQKEAYSISVSDSTNSLNTQYDSRTTLHVEVADWQNDYLIDLNYPDSDNTLGLEYLSDIYRCTVEIPQITPSAVIQLAPGSGGTGRTTDPVRFDIEVANLSSPPVTPGTYTGLIVVEDVAHPKTISIQGDAYYPEFISDIRAYQVFNINVFPNTNFNVVATQNGVDTGLTVALPPACAPDWEGQADLGVFNNGTTSGVYMPNTDNDIVKFDIDYANAPWDGTSICGEGSLVIDMYGTHPCNSGGVLPNQPVYRIDAAASGALIISNMDNNFTINPAEITGLGLTLDIPNSAVVRPFDKFCQKSYYFFSSNPGGSAPGPALGERAWDVFDDADDLGALNGFGYMVAGPNTELGDKIDITCIEEPYLQGSRYRDASLNYMLSDINWAWTFPEAMAADLGTARNDTTKILWILWNDPANPAVRGINIMDDPVASTYAQFLTDPTFTAVDLQILEYDPANPRALNGIGQSSDWICVLYREGVIKVYAEDGSLLDTVDGRTGSGTEDDGSMFWGEAKHLDTDDYDYRIHVTFDSNTSTNPGGNIYVSVFSL
jgi:hypothetical protein